jgi:hypothetical protein
VISLLVSLLMLATPLSPNGHGHHYGWRNRAPVPPPPVVQPIVQDGSPYSGGGGGGLSSGPEKPGVLRSVD